MIQNFVNNVQTVVDNSGEILEGVKEKTQKNPAGHKNLIKVAAVGAITVGTIKIKPEETDKEDVSGKQPE